MKQRKKVVVLGKGSLAIRISDWFFNSNEYDLIYTVPVIPEPTWTDSFKNWSLSKNIPIGSGLGIQNKYNILSIVENATVPIIVDAGVGTASDASIVMELGCDGVLMNTAIACADNPILMASAMKKAVEAGYEAFHAGRIIKKKYASASSPTKGNLFDSK